MLDTAGGTASPFRSSMTCQRSFAANKRNSQVLAHALHTSHPPEMHAECGCPRRMRACRRQVRAGRQPLHPAVFRKRICIAAPIRRRAEHEHPLAASSAAAGPSTISRGRSRRVTPGLRFRSAVHVGIRNEPTSEGVLRGIRRCCRVAVPSERTCRSLCGRPLPDSVRRYARA